MNDILIQCRDLTKAYDGKLALQEVNLSVGRGKLIGLLGPNGSGKTTLIKLLCGLLQPTKGSVSIDGHPIGVYTKSIISYLPDKMYFADWMKAKDLFDIFADFYADFDRPKAMDMCAALGVNPKDKIKTMSKGTKEKVQLVMAMARKAQLYLLDEPIAGVDPAARDFIMSTILTNYNESGTVLISTHLISDIERVLDEAIFLKEGRVILHDSVDNIRENKGMSIDALFRDIFRAVPSEGGDLVC